jgi:hypothetical protein
MHTAPDAYEILQSTYRSFQVAPEDIPDHAIHHFSRLTVAEGVLFLQAVEDLFRPTGQVNATRTGSDSTSSVSHSTESPPKPIHGTADGESNLVLLAVPEVVPKAVPAAGPEALECYRYRQMTMRLV